MPPNGILIIQVNKWKHFVQII